MCIHILLSCILFWALSGLCVQCARLTTICSIIKQNLELLQSYARTNPIYKQSKERVESWEINNGGSKLQNLFILGVTNGNSVTLQQIN